MRRLVLLTLAILFCWHSSVSAVPCGKQFSVGPWRSSTCAGGTLLSYTAQGGLTYYPGKQSPATFDRNSAQTFLDSDGQLHRITTNDIPAFTGMRYVRNLLAADTSEDFSAASWTKAATATVTGTNVLNFPAEGDQIYQIFLTATIPNYGRSYTASVVLSGSGTIRIGIIRSSGTTEQTTLTVTLTSTPTRYSISEAFSLDSTGAALEIKRQAGTTATQVTATNAQLEETTGQTITAPGEYVSTHTAYDGSAVKGARFFSYANGNTVDGNGVVTEAQGAALTGMKGFAYAPAVTNKIAGAYNAVGPDILSTTELMPNQVDRDFSGASAWANVDVNAYNETTDLSLTATAAAQYCTLPVLSAPTTYGKRYRLGIKVSNLVSTWTITNFDGTATLGTITANGTATTYDFTATTTGGLRLVAVANNSAGDFDDFTLKEIGAAKLDGTIALGLGTGAYQIQSGGWKTGALPGITCSGGTDGESSLTIVSDTAKLASATPKLTRINPSGKVYDAIPGATADMNITLTGNLSAATHTVQLAARGETASGNYIKLGDAGGVGDAIELTDEYQIISRTYTATAAGTMYTIPAGSRVKFCLMHSDALTVPVYPVIVEGAAASVVRADWTAPVADGVNWSQAAFTLQTTITFRFASSSIPNSGSFAVYSIADSATNLLYIARSAGGALTLNTTDGTNTVSTALSEWAIGDSITLKATGSKNRNKLNNYSSTDFWGTAGAYDGAIAIGTVHRIGYNSAYPFSLKDTTITNTFDKGGI